MLSRNLLLHWQYTTQNYVQLKVFSVDITADNPPKGSGNYQPVKHDVTKSSGSLRSAFVRIVWHAQQTAIVYPTCINYS
jgi:hypothetical protein